MKLQNKKTGDIGVLNVSNNKYYVIAYGLPLCGNSVLGEYDTLDALMQEWEDYKEPKGIQGFTTQDEDIIIRMGSIEEAEKAVEKLKAWTRLKEKCFKFEGWKRDDRYCGDFTITATDQTSCDDKDLDLLFGGKEWGELDEAHKNWLERKERTIEKLQRLAVAFDMAALFTDDDKKQFYNDANLTINEAIMFIKNGEI